MNVFAGSSNGIPNPLKKYFWNHIRAQKETETLKTTTVGAAESCTVDLKAVLFNQGSVIIYCSHTSSSQSLQKQCVYWVFLFVKWLLMR